MSAKPEERRALIEEAAGIGKYKARRREAESKIGSTEQNLLRVTDVLGEIRRQISSIERAAKKAARYKRLRETVRVLDLSLAADDRRVLVDEIGSARGRLTELGDAVTGLEAQLSEAPDGAQLEQARGEGEAAGAARRHSDEAETHGQRAAVLRAEVAALQRELATLRAAAPRDGSGTHEAPAAAAAAAASTTTKLGPKVVAGRAGCPDAPFADKAEPTAPAVAESPA